MLARFFIQEEWPGGKREKHDTGDRYQLDQVEQALKIQFPDDEIRNHVDRTGKHHNNILEGAVNEDDDHLPGDEQELENNEEDLDALATAQEEAEASASLATLRDAREKHQVRISRGFFPQRYSVIVPETETKVRHLQRSTLGFRVSRKARGTKREERRSDSSCGVQRIYRGRAHRNEHVRKRSTGNKEGR